MALERKWLAVTAQPLTANGTSLGLITVVDTVGLYTKQRIVLVSNSSQPSELQVQEVISPTQLIVGSIGPRVGRQAYVDVSRFLLSDNAQLAAGEQEKNNIPEKDHYSAVYESDPIIADRVILVDEYGRHYRDGNPLPIGFTGSITLGDVKVQGVNGNTLEPNSDGSLNTVAAFKLKGFSTINVSTSIPVSSSSTQLLAINTNRVYAHLINYGTVPAFVQYGNAAVVNHGIRVSPNAILTISGFDLFLGQINAISSTPTAIDVLEGI